MSTLAALIDQPTLASMMDDFFELAGVPMAIIDTEGTVLVGAGWQDVCTKFHRVHPQTCRACIESDTQLSEGVAPGEFRIYKCKNSMWDAATPIIVRDRHIGNVFAGQFFFDGETIDYERFRAQARRYGFDEEAYIRALDRAPRLPRAAVESALSFFVELAQMVSRLADANITLSRTTEQLAQANRVKDEFLATLSHELRTPLNAILGWSQMLALQSLDTETTKRAAASIARNAEAQAELIGEILDVSRIITGKLHLVVAPVDLGAVLRDAVEAVGPAVAAKHLDLQVDIEDQARHVSGDAARLRQVFWNLLSNAVKFTPRGGLVVATVRRSGSQVEIRVGDSGVGIPPEFLPRVFDRFWQADSSTTRRHGGLGLGLSIVRYVVELHGGTVTAESEGENRGTTFTIRLPIRAVREAGQSSDGEEKADAARRGWDATAPDALTGISVLVVDDEADARELVHGVLVHAGASVEDAGSAVEAVEALSRRPFDVLCADIGMPDEDGYTLIRRIRSLPGEAGGTVPAVALTAYGRPEDRLRALSAGFQQHVVKPVTPVELVAIVARLTGRRLGRS